MENQINQVAIRLVKDSPLITDEVLDKPAHVASVVGDFIRDMDREVLCVVNFTAKLQPINFNIVSIGTVNQTVAVPRDILKSAILSNAVNMMVIHNHPSGILEPSKADVQVTDKLINICNDLGIPLLDHIIVGPKKDEYFSMNEKRTVNFNRSSPYCDNVNFLNFKPKQEARVSEEINGKSR